MMKRNPLAKQDEKQRLRRRLQEYAIELGMHNNWGECIDINKQILELGEDPSTYNRLGKAYMEQGVYQEARDAYQQTLRLNPTNTIARKNLARLESLLARGIERPPYEEPREQVDLRLFITEAGKTILTTLLDVPRGSAMVDTLSPGERLDLKVDGRVVYVIDVAGNHLGRLEPKIGQRLSELITGGNRYIVAVAQSDPRQIRVLLRETYQHPDQHGRTSFPGRLTEQDGTTYLPTRYDYETEDLLEDEETVEETDILSEEFVSSGGEEEEELGLEDIEKEIADDEENAEE